MADPGAAPPVARAPELVQPSPLFRAPIRDRFGDGFINQGEFGLGLLEVK